MKKLYHFTPMVLLVILLVIFIILFEAALYVTRVMFKPEIYGEAMNEKEVAQAMYDEINTNFGYYTPFTGVPAEVFTSTYGKDELYTASYKLLTDSLAYMTDKSAAKPVISYDFSKIEKSITDYIEKDAEERNLEKNKDYYSMIAETVKLSKEQITSRLDVMMLYKLSGTGIGATFHKHSYIFGYAVLGLLGAILAVLTVMVIIDRHHPRDLPYWAGVALTASSAALLLPAVYLKSTGYFESFFIKSEYIHLTVTGLFDIVLKDIIRFETVMLIIGVLLIISAQVIHMLYVRHLQNKWKHDRLLEHRLDDAEAVEDNDESAEAAEPTAEAEAIEQTAEPTVEPTAEPTVEPTAAGE